MRTYIEALKINKNKERADQAQFNSTYYVCPNVSQPSSQDKKSGSLLPKEIKCDPNTSLLSPLSQVSLRHHQAMDVLTESHRKSQSLLRRPDNSVWEQ